MIADAGQMSYSYPRLHAFFGPGRGLAPGLAFERQSESKGILFLHSEKNYTEKI